MRVPFELGGVESYLIWDEEDQVEYPVRLSLLSPLAKITTGLIPMDGEKHDCPGCGEGAYFAALEDYLGEPRVWDDNSDGLTAVMCRDCGLELEPAPAEVTAGSTDGDGGNGFPASDPEILPNGEAV